MYVPFNCTSYGNGNNDVDVVKLLKECDFIGVASHRSHNFR